MGEGEGTVMQQDLTPSSALWPGVPLALGSAILFGASAPVAKLLVGIMDPGLLAGLMYLGAGTGLVVAKGVRRILRLARREAALTRRDWPTLAAVTLFGGVLGPLLLMFGLSLTSAATASLLLNAEGLATMAIAWVVFRENVDQRLLLGAAAILVGAVLLSWTGRGLALEPGGLLILAACLCWGIDNNLARKLSAADPVDIAMIKGLVAGGVNLAVALMRGGSLPGPTLVASAAVVGLLGIGISLVMFMRALRHLGTARTGAYFSLAPFIGAGIALILFGEPITLQLTVAGLLMGFGLWLHLAEHHDHWHVHDELEHDHAHVHDAHHQHEHLHEGPVTGPHAHPHRHSGLRHRHPHYPDLHHRHRHDAGGSDQDRSP